MRTDTSTAIPNIETPLLEIDIHMNAVVTDGDHPGKRAAALIGLSGASMPRSVVWGFFSGARNAESQRIISTQNFQDQARIYVP